MYCWEHRGKLATGEAAEGPRFLWPLTDELTDPSQLLKFIYWSLKTAQRLEEKQYLGLRKQNKTKQNLSIEVLEGSEIKKKILLDYKGSQRQTGICFAQM